MLYCLYETFVRITSLPYTDYFKRVCNIPGFAIDNYK